jgi:uncharacterized membrane protein
MSLDSANNTLYDEKTGEENNTVSESAAEPNGSELESKEPIEGVLERLAEKDPDAARKITKYIVQQKIHQGPMPSPEDIREYAVTQSDLPERMMLMAEKSQDNKARHADKVLALKQQEIELNVGALKAADLANKRDSSNQTLSLILAFIVVLICVLGSFYLAIIDKTAVALVIGGTTLVGVVAAFLKGKSITSNNKSDESDN